MDRAQAALADAGSLTDTDVMDVSRLAIRVVWRWHTALPGRRAIRPEQASWDAMGVVPPPRSAAGRRRLVRMLSDRRDWAGLLRLAMGPPIRDAVVIRWPQAYRPVEVATPFKGLLNLADRPQAQWKPADLSYVRGARSLAEEKTGILPLYDLVAACMEWHFATEAASLG